MRLMRAQGATEYLVLLAVVLIVALISVALLGFMPGMASDAQITQSKAYWSSASPIAIIETDARFSDGSSVKPYLLVRNGGAYPIRITKLIGTGGTTISAFYSGGNFYNISDYFYLAPGEEKYFADNAHSYSYSVPLNRDIAFCIGASGSLHFLSGVSSVCTGTGLGVVNMKDFGFEYIAYVEGQPITKRQIGAKPLIIKCTG